MIDTKVEHNLRPINIDLTKEFMKAGEIIVSECRRGISTNRDITGNRFPPLADATIFAKGHERPLIDLNVLRRSLVKEGVKKVAKNHVTVEIIDKGEPPRNEVAYYLQIEGVEQKTGARKHFMLFGISEKSEKRIWAMVKRKVSRQIRGGR